VEGKEGKGKGGREEVEAGWMEGSFEGQRLLRSVEWTGALARKRNSDGRFGLRLPTRVLEAGQLSFCPRTAMMFNISNPLQNISLSSFSCKHSSHLA